MLDYYIQNSPEPIFVFDKESLKFLEINQSALNLYGYTREEFLRLDLTDLYSPEDFQSLMESLKNSVNEKTTPVFKQKTKDGKDIYVQLTYNDFKYNDLDSFFVIVKDITKNLWLESENKLFKELIENTSDIIIETDEFGFIKSINNSAISKLGYNLDYLLDSSFSSLVPDEERGIINSKLFNGKIKSLTELKTSVKKSNGQFIEANVISVPVKNLNDEINSFRLIITLEEKIKEAVTEVREVIKEVIVEKPVPVASSQSGQSFLSSDFLSGVFHEILTPLNVIFGFTQEIVEGLDKPTPEQKEAADIISQNRIKLLDTMNSVVEYSELVSNNSHLNISEFSLVDVIEKLEKQAKDIANTFGIQFTLGKISSSLKVESDAEKLERVIIGLIKIVCRLSQEKKIYLSTFALDQELFLISVTDQYNSSTDYLTNTLNKIFNLQIEPRDVGAPRLTVHLTRFFMNLLKMKFVDKIKINDKVESGFLLPLKLKQTETFESQVDKNQLEAKQFVVSEIPEVVTKPVSDELKVSSSIKSSTQESPKVDLSSLSCLYIEDQIDSQVLFKVQLKELKEIVVAPSFEEALPHLESRKFDFIVIDINLEGEYNGLDALKLIRKIPAYEKTPIFASTAYILPGNKERFIAAGFNSFIDKPIFKERIIQSLSEILSN
jgi:PAS domain S-box-containing protein